MRPPACGSCGRTLRVYQTDSGPPVPSLRSRLEDSADRSLQEAHGRPFSREPWELLVAGDAAGGHRARSTCQVERVAVALHQLEHQVAVLLETSDLGAVPDGRPRASYERGPPSETRYRRPSIGSRTSESVGGGGQREAPGQARSPQCKTSRATSIRCSGRCSPRVPATVRRRRAAPRRGTRARRSARRVFPPRAS